MTKKLHPYSALTKNKKPRTEAATEAAAQRQSRESLERELRRIAEVGLGWIAPVPA